MRERERECVCVRERERVCVSESESVGQRESVNERETDSAYVCVRERERGHAGHRPAPPRIPGVSLIRQSMSDLGTCKTVNAIFWHI